MTDTNDNLNPNGLTWMGKRLEDCTREELIRAAVLTAESKHELSGTPAHSAWEGMSKEVAELWHRMEPDRHWSDSDKRHAMRNAINLVFAVRLILARMAEQTLK